MLDAAILGRATLGCSPFIDRSRSVVATRLTVFSLVVEALAGGAGPFQPYLAMIGAAEGLSVSDFRKAADVVLMSIGAVNLAQLRALVAAGSLE